MEPQSQNNPLAELMQGIIPQLEGPTEEELAAKEKARLQALQKKWLRKLSEEKTAHKEFRDRARDVEEVYRQLSYDDELFVPLYWQAVNIEHVGVYSNQPVPDVRPRNETQNPIFKNVAKAVQRGLNYCVSQISFDDNMNRTVDDYLAMALGTSRVKVDSVISTNTVSTPVFTEVFNGYDPNTGLPTSSFQQTGTETEEVEEIGDQLIRWEYIPWRRFGWQPCNNWTNCGYIFIRHAMTNDDMIERFDRPVVASTDNDEEKNTESWKSKTRDIYEIWDKETKTVLFIAKGESEPMEVNEDPLQLVDFFPCPPPMMMNLESEELIPKPDYDYIESYDIELNRLQARRMAIMETIKATGAYDKGLPELGDIMEQDDGKYLPIQNLMQRVSAAGGMENAFMHIPLQEKAGVLQQLTQQTEFVRAQVDDILGITDIVRGVTQASESATAQEIKGRWVGIRLTRKRECVQYTCREMMRIMGQLLASHITPENLFRMTQMEITPEMLNILQDDMLMQFVISIETDSTIAKDEFKERETRQEMLNGVAQFAQSVLPMVQANALPASIASAMLRSALAPYAKYDRDLDEALNSLQTNQEQLQQLSQQTQEAQQQAGQATQEKDHWQAIAVDLQNKATEASSHQKNADAGKKKAETAQILTGLPDDELQEDKTEMEIATGYANVINQNKRPLQ